MSATPFKCSSVMWSAVVKSYILIKEKLPQAFMQIGWMAKWIRNPTAKVWGNLDNPIKRYVFFKVFINFLFAALSGGTLLQSVMSQHGNCLMELHKFNILVYHENVSSLYF